MPESGWNTTPWNMVPWNGPGSFDFIFPVEVVCVEAEAVFTVEIEGEVPVCDDDG
jgi:hypothetical protein